VYSDVATSGEDGYDDGVAGAAAKVAAVTQPGCGDVINRGRQTDNVGRHGRDGFVLSCDGS
jgi:hypothetical protein